jgi:hypothetical protein
VGVAAYFRGRGKKSRQMTTFEVFKKYHKACELLFKKAFLVLRHFYWETEN